MPASVFLSYASEDRQPARSIGDALARFGLDVWLDESELGGGDAWDQKIRRQIRECDYFMPIVSARTEARHEGYFRREWRMAVERTLDMADDHLFLLPVVIDDTEQGRARVPEKFLAVQWLRVPDGQPTPALEALCRRILSGDPAEPRPAKQKSARAEGAATASRRIPAAYPAFPREEPGQRVRFWAHVLGWMGRCTWVSLQRLPRWLRILIYIWVVGVTLSRGCSNGSGDRSEPSRAEVRKLKAIAEAYRGSTHPEDISKLGAAIAKEATGGAAGSDGPRPVLAIPFAAPGGDAAAAKFADAAFAQTFGMLAVSHHGQIGLDTDTLDSNEASAAVDRARASHADFVIYGAVHPRGSTQVLSVSIVKVSDGSVVWTQGFPVATANPATIAQQVESNLPSTASDDD